MTEQDVDQRISKVYELVGLAMMAVAILDCFGWSGALFVVGFISYQAGLS